MKKWLLFIVLISLLIVPTVGQADSWQESFQNDVKWWAKELAAKDQRFATFEKSPFTTKALGQNSEQWLVIFQLKDKPSGYMVVAENNNHLELLEYGLGESTLFYKPMVAPFLTNKNEELHSFYAGLESVWESPMGIYDAKSGEEYPPTTRKSIVQGHVAIQAKATLEKALHHTKELKESYAWVKPQGQIDMESNLIKELGKKPLTYVADLFNHTVIAPYAATGYHVWNGVWYVELDDYGSRFIPVDYAKSIGKFIE